MVAARPQRRLAPGKGRGARPPAARTQGQGVTLGPSARGRRLDQALVEAFPALSRARLQALIRQGQVRVDQRTAKASARMSGGERIQLTLPPAEPALPEPEDLPLSVLFQDRDLLVLDKAPGMVVHPAAGHRRGTLVNALLHHVRDLQGVGGALRPGLVHRLDKDTSGCLVVAKNDAALRGLQASFKTRQVQKTYLALVHGQPPEQGRIETAYGRHPRHRQRFTGRLTEGKPARTGFRVLERLHGAALLEVDLLTGRTHQIRVHLAEAGYPLLGDVLYGGTRKGDARVRAVQTTLGRQALHAWRLAFPHPRTGARRAFEAKVPADLRSALTALRMVRP